MTVCVCRAVRRGFTLIELLIVVGILAVLAAIATPNYLEAQVRAKVSRTHNDLRSLATAIESYRTDNNTYPVVGNLMSPVPADTLTGFYARLWNLTTPVAYLSDLAADPFAVAGKPAGVGLRGDPLSTTDPIYCYCPGNFYFDRAGNLLSVSEYVKGAFSIGGRGPDSVILFGALCMAHPAAVAVNALARGSYDPTNGTMSEGDILRVGGGSLR